MREHRVTSGVTIRRRVTDMVLPRRFSQHDLPFTIQTPSRLRILLVNERLEEPDLFLHDSRGIDVVVLEFVPQPRVTTGSLQGLLRSGQLLPGDSRHLIEETQPFGAGAGPLKVKPIVLERQDCVAAAEHPLHMFNRQLHIDSHRDLQVIPEVADGEFQQIA